ncbi:hypothetical protein M409DRAFT_29332 [Zasmidium cellare ATCC 36951]|uniref:Uncharacterized protein n=1 Tax=Zasmidium cellare ATCC 36951 TaxID=1080233 RepID=A0A6A6C2Z8_ZASCE|nr:uncharacterized protein M409DRAFT_29332 [Zasmidium cellare ATCC 36951]KAF2160242.1 hypothetical protein M409DRAFT_29332 [Zasmidium cellare ATCC 36951]
MIRTAAKWGTIAYIGNKAAKAYGEHSNQQQPPMPYPPQQASSSRGPGTQIREANGYLHQTWCNGQCGLRCNDGMQNSSRDAPVNVPRLGEAEDYYGGFETRGMNNGNLPEYKESRDVSSANLSSGKK